MSLCRKNVIITIDFYRKYPTSTSSTYLPTTIGMRNKIWNLLFICHENLATKFRSTHIFLFYHVKYYYGLGWKATQAGRSDLLLLMCVCLLTAQKYTAGNIPLRQRPDLLCPPSYA